MFKKLLITGGAGFVGHHVVEGVLKNTDWNIVVLDKLNYASGGFDRLRDISVFDSKRVLCLTADLSKPLSLGIIKEIGKVDYIWHLAAESHVDKSLRNAVSFAKANVLGTTYLLEYVKRYQPHLKKYIQFSTDEVYGPAQEGYYNKEWDTMKPSNPYAASKAGADMMAFSFAHAFNLPIIITRTMNIIGERQHPEKFVPKVIRQILEGEKITLHGRSKENISSRCWIHARNVESALRFLTEIETRKEDMFHIVGEERSVYEIANKVCQVIKGRELKEDEVEFIDFHSARPGHDKRYALNGEKLRKLGWKSPKNLDGSLEKMIEWMIKPENRKWLEV